MTTSGTSQNSMWFSVSIGLMGLILGYSVATVGHSGLLLASASPSSAPAAPTVPSAPAAADPAADPSAAQPAVVPLPPIDWQADHVIGPKNAKVTFVEYMDYECPFCKRHYDTMKQLRTIYKDDVDFAMRHFPLDFHQNALPEALAAECVADLGGTDMFWKFSDLLMERTTSNGTGFAIADLAPLAKEVGADQTKFTACFDSKKFLTKVQDEEKAGIASGINGTPGNAIVNNNTKETKLMSGAMPLATFQTQIDAMLGKQ